MKFSYAKVSFFFVIGLYSEVSERVASPGNFIQDSRILIDVNRTFNLWFRTKSENYKQCISLDEILNEHCCTLFILQELLLIIILETFKSFTYIVFVTKCHFLVYKSNTIVVNSFLKISVTENVKFINHKTLIS